MKPRKFTSKFKTIDFPPVEVIDVNEFLEDWKAVRL